MHVRHSGSASRRIVIGTPRRFLRNDGNGRVVKIGGVDDFRIRAFKTFKTAVYFSFTFGNDSGIYDVVIK